MSWSELQRLVSAAEADLRAARVKHAVERRRRVRPMPPRPQPQAC